jgi:hypothetical protein
MGLTVMQNQRFDATVSNWDLDAQVMNSVKEIVVASGRITGEVVPLAASSADIRAIEVSAGAQGFDAVLAVLPEASSGADYLAPGPTLSRRKLPDFDKSWACNGMALDIFRISDGKQIGHDVHEHV